MAIKRKDKNGVWLSSKRKHLSPSSKIYNIRKRAYYLSIKNPHASEIDNWLEAERFINQNYPD